VTRPGFPDFFSRDASAYAQFRPRYPAALFAWVAELPAGRRRGLDCGTGNGQAATMLAQYFPAVLAIDASRSQLLAAERHRGVTYAASLVEAMPVRAASVDLVCVAQAFHWMDHGRFYSEVDRIAAPGAALAIWGYGRLHTAPELDAILNRFHDETVGPYWSPERRHVEEGYRGFAIPIAETPAPPLAIESSLSLDQLLGYLRTWSAVGKYLAAHGHDPVTRLAPELAAAWGDPAGRRLVRWPLFVRAGRWRGAVSPPGRTSP